ncbi:MAG: hypothetical protein FWD16_00950, partial [Clostridia bacterium]|nr:hypothetical protein [Clostridia bacterium]
MPDNTIGPFGHFHPESPATYVITNRAMEVPWEYIYQNRDILLRVDQYGPVSAQFDPPQDITLFKRDHDEKFSKWLYWLQCDELNGGLPFTNFFGPVAGGNPALQPDKTEIIYSPHEAVYRFTVGPLVMTTTLFIPRKGADIVCNLSLKNTGEKPLHIKATSALIPHINPPSLPLWDKPEWYLRTGFGLENEIKEQLVFWSQLFHSGADREKRRAATLWCTAEDATTFEISAEKFMGLGDLSNPSAPYGALRLDKSACKGYAQETPDNTIYGYPPVYSAQYNLDIKNGETKELKQVLSVQPLSAEYLLPDLQTAKKPLQYFNNKL